MDEFPETPVGPDVIPPNRYFGKFDADGSVRGFWVDDVWRPELKGARDSRIPEDVVEITKEVWQELLSNPGTTRYLNGAVQHFTRDPIPPTPPSYVELMLFEYENRLRVLEGKPPMSLNDFVTSLSVRRSAP